MDARGRERVQTEFLDESLTVQSDAQAADIREILKQYKEVGIVENLNDAEAMFADISEFTDFADAMRHAKDAEREFMKLPSKVREMFGHDVAVWLDTAHDQEKRDALVEAGIIEGLVVGVGEAGTTSVPAKEVAAETQTGDTGSDATGDIPPAAA